MRNSFYISLEEQRHSLTMSYDNMHNILGKTQVHETSLDNTDWKKVHQTTYDLAYSYDANNKPHAPREIIDQPEANSIGNDVKTKLYDYDPNGNMTALTQKTGDSETIEKLRTNLWDEENRLRAVDINPDAEGVRPITIYTYDAGGERVLKHSNTSVSIYLNGKKVADTIQVDATLYPSGMLVARLGNNGSEEEQTLAYTKHYYAGTQRVSSKIGTTENLGDYLYDWFTGGMGGPVDVIGSSFGVLENAEQGVVQVYDELGIDPPTYESTPVFIPVQNFVHGGNEVEQYFFHPDHLGSTSYITNLLGEVSQHMEYFAFGETFVEEHRSSNNSPYKFNGKELDEETGWYYYGARYYDPRISVWLSVDPLASYDPIQNKEHYIDGQHNGGVFNAMNLNVYGYCYQNPVLYLDPNGKQVKSIKDGVGSGKNVTNDITASVSRPAMKSIDGIVLHRTVSSSASSAITTAKNHKGATGFHIVIDKNGSTTQIVNFNNRANHVGKQKTDIGNYNSIGIEVVGNYNSSTKQWDPLTPEQIESTAQAVYTMMNEYGLSIDDVFPHEDVSWKTAGEGQVVMDAIESRLNELTTPVVDKKSETNIYEERRLQQLIGSPEKMDGGIRAAYDAEINSN